MPAPHFICIIKASLYNYINNNSSGQDARTTIFIHITIVQFSCVKAYKFQSRRKLKKLANNS